MLFLLLLSLLLLLLLLLLLPLLLLSLQRCRACIGRNFDLSFFTSWSSILYSCDTDFHQHQPHPGLAPGVHNVLFSFYSYLSSFVSPFSLCCVCVCVCVCVSFPATVIGVVSAHCCRRCYRSLKEASHTSSRRTRHGSFASIWRTASSSHRTAALP